MNMIRNQVFSKGPEDSVPESHQVIGEDNQAITDICGPYTDAQYPDMDIRTKNHHRGFGSVVSIAHPRSLRDRQASAL